MKSIVSIHDVMPDTFNNVMGILETLKNCSVPDDKIYLLIVPGLAWRPSQLQTLKSLQSSGYQFSGHGWLHRIQRKTAIKHHLHAALISRNVAEHLSLRTDEISDLIERNYGWFIDNGFSAPQLYVPPAWAMGAIDLVALQRLPFRYYEYSSGILDSNNNRFESLALTGYEADRWWRVPFLQSWNRLNTHWLARRRALRIAIHPNDFQFRMSREMLADIGRSREFLSCAEVFAKRRIAMQQCHDR